MASDEGVGNDGGSSLEEVNWDRLDKKRFFVYGAGAFSSVTCCLYPLTVIKTKQQVLPGVSGSLKGVKQTVRHIWRNEGVPGFYRGFGTVVCGTIPARVVYLTTLEYTKSKVARVATDLQLSDAATAGLSNAVGGGIASLTTQCVTVPIDVVSQKQMMHGDRAMMSKHASSSSSSGAAGSSGTGPSSSATATSGPAPSATSAPRPAAGVHAPVGSAGSSVATAAAERTAQQVSTSAAAAAAASPAQRMGAVRLIQHIVATEGVAGLYRGFGASIATFVPSSAVWWGAYGAYQKAIWKLVHADQPHGVMSANKHSTAEVMSVQTTSSVLAGCTSSLVSTPLDLAKTRIQVAWKADGPSASFVGVLRQVVRDEGPAGLLRGALPRMLNASLWGTAMVTVYEFLKRVCQAEDEGAGAVVAVSTTQGAGRQGSAPARL